MLDCVPEIVVDDVAAPAPKRRRLNALCHGASNLEAANKSPKSKPTPQLNSTHPSFAAPEDICEDSLVCFGMILDLPVDVSSVTAGSPTCTQDTVRFHPPRTLRHSVSDRPVGQLDDYGGTILLRLIADDEFELQLALSPSPVITTADKKACKGITQFLGIILYGPRRRFGDVGDFVSQSGCYLDDPVGCDRNVPYMNPQCLFSLQERPPMTFELSQPQQHSVEDFARTSLDILADFETTNSLELSASPTALRTNLQPHQREALTFLLRRERGLHPCEDGFGIWLRKTSVGQTNFVNVLTDDARLTPGPLWRGGLLADEMGLGKTLSMIALIASDQDRDTRLTSMAEVTASEAELHSTLIIVPLGLLYVWESQLKSHLRDGRLTWFVHHGKRRFRPANRERPPDIVFTTYQTVERENRNVNPGTDTVFSHHWRRIILDEAHIIRNHNTSTARAVSALRATSRWAVSGTPIQNNLGDFLGLFKFLHFVPYDDPKVFDNDISDLWRSRPVDKAVDTFKKLLSSVMLRRTKVMLDLPSRKDKILRIPFGNDEADHYRSIEHPIVDMLDRAPANGSQTSIPWMTAIQQINKLRLVCNLGTYVPSRQLCFSQLGGSDDKPAAMAARFSMGGETCLQCLLPVEFLQFSGGLRDSTSPKVYYSTCNRFYCADCSGLLQYRSPHPCDCTGTSQPCLLRPMVSLLPTPRLTPTEDFCPSPMERDDMSNISSKVWALMSQITTYPEEKHVVFSSWTSSLDMVERALRSDPNYTIQFVRIDGKVPTNKRGQAIQQFHNDPNKRVILITVACGACGLDLTAASRVHLLEPQWNPSLEDQAFARVHRLGQTRPVTTIRYVMENSFEEHILKVQDRKKLLATTLLSNGSSLESLRQLLHESKEHPES